VSQAFAVFLRLGRAASSAGGPVQVHDFALRHHGDGAQRFVLVALLADAVEYLE
jgi:hypothetical protein